jgi:hypothetical protein
LRDGRGFNDPEQIKQFMARANSELGWNAGTMLWLWDITGDPNAIQWFEIIYG